MPTRQSTQDRLTDDATMIALEARDEVVHMYSDAVAIEKHAANVRRHARQAVTALDGLQQVFADLSRLTLVAERGRAQADDRLRGMGMAV